MKKIINLPKSIIEFFKSVIAELGKVEWLSKRNLYRYSLINIIFITALTLIVFGLDQAFLNIRNLLI